MTDEQHPWRTRAAVLALVGPALAQLVDALLGGSLVDFPTMLLLAAVSGYAVGAWAPPRTGIAAVVATAVLITAASQVFDPDEYPVLDDLVFFLLVAGAPALAGAAVAGRARQVRELRRLAALLDAQHEAEVRSTRIRERNRIERDLHRGFSEQVAAIAMRAESAAGTGPAERERALAEIESTARATLDDLREALGTLRERPGSAGTELPDPTPATLATTGVVKGTPPPLDWGDAAIGVAVGLAIGIEGGLSPDARGPVVANLALGLAVGAPLAFRRARPVLAAALCFAAAVMMSSLLTPITAMVTAILPLLLVPYAAGAHARTWRHRLLVLGVFAVGAWAAVIASSAEHRDPDGSWPMIVWAALAFGAGLATGGWAARAAQEERATAELARGHDIALRLAVAEQRAALARDLHDTVAHALTVVCLQSSAGRIPGATPDDALATVLSAARTGLAELREGLGAMGDDDVLEEDALRDHALSVGLAPEVRMVGDLAAASAPVRTVAARVVREAVVNAGRYAPGSRVVVSLEADDQRLRVEVVDTGPAAGPVSSGLGAGTGLAGLAEEVRRTGGRLSSGPDAGGGYRVCALLPLSRTLEPIR